MSIIGQAVVDGYLGLSLLEQIILTVSSFSLVLILLFDPVRTALNRRHSRRHEIERLSGELQDTQSAHELEREQLNSKLQEIEKTLEAQLTTQRMPSVGGTASYPLLKDSELQDTSFENRTIYIADFANQVRNRKFSTVVVSNLVFKNCCIVGPAVLVAINTGQIGGKTFDDDCKWDGGIQAFWTSDERMDLTYYGTVGLEDCVFRSCYFASVGILLSTAEVQAIRTSANGKGES